MTLTTDTTLGSYKIESLIGRGGMGEVYRARDTGLDRSVAIKVLPESFAANAERVARFEREARLLATLSHQNIAGIHGLEEQDGLRYLVLELVEGETLKHHLEKGATPIEETLRICCQIADAVAAAHERGIIHRDLKPANIMITADDTVKVLDFGIAKALDASGTGTSMAYAATLSADHNTAAGTMVGTPTYMSPEQARGKAIDKRSDIWSFGCVLYECLTGETAFGGETVTDTFAKILERDPDYTRIPAATPPTVQMLLRRCLQKDRKKRLHDIGDARVQIEEAIADPSGSTLGLSGSYVAVSSPRPGAPGLPWLITAFVTLLAVAAWWRPGIAPETHTRPAPTMRLSVVSPDVEINWENPQFDLSPDGQQVVLVARPLVAEDADPEPYQLYIRRFDDFEATPIPGTERAWWPRFSPSGEWIAFFSFDPSTGRRVLKRVQLDNSPAITVCDLTHDTFWSLIWISEDTLLLSRRAGVENSSATVSVDSGALEYVEFKTEGLGDYQGLYPSSLLPGGTSALGTAWRVIGTQTHGDAVLISLEDWSCRKILDNAITPTYSASGHLLLERDHVLLAAPFDADAGKVTGRVMPLISGVRDFDIADSGVLVYHPTAGSPKNRRLMTIDAKGNIQPLSPVKKPFRQELASSADGRWLGVVASGDRELPRIWLYELQTGLIRPLTAADEVCFGPKFSPDGRYVSYVRWDSEKPSLMVAPVDGSEAAREILSFKLSEGFWAPSCWTVDSQAILVTWSKNTENDRDIMRLDLDFDALAGKLPVSPQPVPVLASAARENGARLSPKGKWLAYYSNETGEEHVHIRSYDAESGAVGPSRLVTTKPGVHSVLWAHDGSKIYFLDEDEHLLAVTVTTEPELTLSEPEKVLDAGELRMADERLIPLPDGERFVFIQKGKEEKEKEHLNVVLNWFEELKKKVPVQVTQADRRGM